MFDSTMQCYKMILEEVKDPMIAAVLTLANNVEYLHSIQQKENDLAFAAQGSYIFNFGKFKNRAVKDIERADLQAYNSYLMQMSQHQELTRDAQEALAAIHCELSERQIK